MYISMRISKTATLPPPLFADSSRVIKLSCAIMCSFPLVHSRSWRIIFHHQCYTCISFSFTRKAGNHMNGGCEITWCRVWSLPQLHFPNSCHISVIRRFIQGWWQIFVKSNQQEIFVKSVYFDGLSYFNMCICNVLL